jgi:hypothetical protein
MKLHGEKMEIRNQHKGHKSNQNPIKNWFKQSLFFTLWRWSSKSIWNLIFQRPKEGSWLLKMKSFFSMQIFRAVMSVPWVRSSKLFLLYYSGLKLLTISFSTRRLDVFTTLLICPGVIYSSAPLSPPITLMPVDKSNAFSYVFTDGANSQRK